MTRKKDGLVTALYDGRISERDFIHDAVEQGYSMEEVHRILDALKEHDGVS